MIIYFIIPTTIELYLPKDVKKIILRKVVNGWGGGRITEDFLNINLLEYLERLREYVDSIKISRMWRTPEGQIYSQEGLLL
ncbi:MAG: hypothetical protein QXG91_03555 [Candidatus Aenigmatarchaeota archaeon]